MSVSIRNEDPCLCSSGMTYSSCCQPVIDGRTRATTAESLMRSRYTAYCLGASDYLQKTWSETTRPVEFDMNEPPMAWTGLRVIGSEAGGPEDEWGAVEFVASFDVSGEVGQLHERSVFVREQGEWRYRDGTTGVPTTRKPDKLGRNEPCHCGSGKKYKKCCCD